MAEPVADGAGRLLGAAAAEQVDQLVDSLRGARNGDHGWVSSPFFLDLTLRKS